MAIFMIAYLHSYERLAPLLLQMRVPADAYEHRVCARCNRLATHSGQGHMSEPAPRRLLVPIAS